jgi:hypothetical protein
MTNYDNYRRLAISIILAAVMNTCKGEKDALEWLENDGLLLAELAGLKLPLFRIADFYAAGWNKIRDQARERIRAEDITEKTY